MSTTTMCSPSGEIKIAIVGRGLRFRWTLEVRGLEHEAGRGSDALVEALQELAAASGGLEQPAREARSLLDRLGV